MQRLSSNQVNHNQPLKLQPQRQQQDDPTEVSSL
jgi:hypothetical protein